MDKKTPYVQQSSSNVALVRFITDKRDANKGFLAKYTAGNALGIINLVWTVPAYELISQISQPDLAIYFLSEYANLFQDSDSSEKDDGDLDQAAVENIAKSAFKAGISVESLKQAVSWNQQFSSNSSLRNW